MGFMDWLKGLGGKKQAEPDRVVVNHEEQVAPPAPAAEPSVASSPVPGAAPADPGSKDTI
jgi:hypothetical protein